MARKAKRENCTRSKKFQNTIRLEICGSWCEEKFTIYQNLSPRYNWTTQIFTLCNHSTCDHITSFYEWHPKIWDCKTLPRYVFKMLPNAPKHFRNHAYLACNLIVYKLNTNIAPNGNINLSVERRGSFNTHNQTLSCKRKSFDGKLNAIITIGESAENSLVVLSCEAKMYCETNSKWNSSFVHASKNPMKLTVLRIKQFPKFSSLTNFNLLEYMFYLVIFV